MRQGDAFIPISDVALRHLWIVITEPSERGRVVIVNVTTRRPGSDDTCVLQVNDHPFIRHESVIAYQYARLTRNAVLGDSARRQLLQMRQPVSPQLLERIQNGALASAFTPRGVKAAVAKQLGQS